MAPRKVPKARNNSLSLSVVSVFHFVLSFFSFFENKAKRSPSFTRTQYLLFAVRFVFRVVFLSPFFAWLTS